MDRREGLVKVEYVGKADCVAHEFNGRRYAFTKKFPVRVMTIAAFKGLVKSGAVFAEDIIPYRSEEQQAEYEREFYGDPQAVPQEPAAGDSQEESEQPGNEEAGSGADDVQEEKPQEPARRLIKKRRRKQ